MGYDDYNEYDDYKPFGIKEVTCNQPVRIYLKYNDDFSREEQWSITEKIANYITEHPDTITEPFKVDNFKNDIIMPVEANDYNEVLIFYKAKITVDDDNSPSVYEGRNLINIIDTDSFYYRENEENENKTEMANLILKNIKAAGFTEVEKIIDIFGEDLEENLSEYYPSW